MLLVAAARSLSVQEISTCLALKGPGRHPNEDDLLIEPKDQIHRFCWLLVAFEAGDNLQIIPASVADFLTQQLLTVNRASFATQECHAYMAPLCLYRLLHIDFASLSTIRPLMGASVDGSTASDLAQITPALQQVFWLHASKYWHSHVMHATPSNALITLAGRFCTNKDFIAESEASALPRRDLGNVIEVRSDVRPMDEADRKTTRKTTIGCLLHGPLR